MFGPVALAESVGLAGVETWDKSPPEWGTHWEGFARRIASNVGWGVIKQSTTFGLDEVLMLDSYYYRSKNKSFGARLANALVSPVTARTKSGRRTIGVPRLVGNYASAVIVAESWYPQRYSWKDGLRAGTWNLGFDMGFNIFKEFIWKK
jgi:hypothetical protein